MTARFKFRRRKTVPVTTVVLKRKHARKCWYADGQRDPWWIPSDGIAYADKSGRLRRGRKRWIVLQCNSTNCRAACLVLEDAVTTLAVRVLRKLAKQRSRKAAGEREG